MANVSKKERRNNKNEIRRMATEEDNKSGVE